MRYTETKLTYAKDVKPGDMLDLEGDKYADPDNSNPCLQSELCVVAQVEQETPGCIVIYFDGLNGFGFPPEHVLKVEGFDEEYTSE